MMKQLFSLIAAVVTVYTLACFVRVLISCVPGWGYNRVSRFLGELCDPYLNYFRRFKFLHFGNLDFSPVAALALLGAVSSLASGISAAQKMSVGVILAQAVAVCSSVISSILGLLILLLIIRLVSALVAPHSTYGLWVTLDRSFAPFLDRLSTSFKHRPFSWTGTLALGLAVLIVVNLLQSFVLRLLVWILAGLPF
jgi:YggT family protein